MLASLPTLPYIGQKNGRLEDGALVTAGSSDDGKEVVERTLCLGLDAALDDLHRLGVQRDAAGAVDDAVVHRRLDVRANGAWCVGG